MTRLQPETVKRYVYIQQLDNHGDSALQLAAKLAELKCNSTTDNCIYRKGNS